jgi:hypothetical protein
MCLSVPIRSELISFTELGPLMAGASGSDVVLMFAAVPCCRARCSPRRHVRCRAGPLCFPWPGQAIVVDERCSPAPQLDAHIHIGTIMISVYRLANCALFRPHSSPAGSVACLAHPGGDKEAQRHYDPRYTPPTTSSLV